MASPKQIIRSAMAVFFGIAYLLSVPQMLPLLASAFLHGDHGHEAQVVEHYGHSDLVFHHAEDHEDEDHHGGDHDGHPAFDSFHLEEHSEGCHVFQLPSDTTSTFVSSLPFQAPVLNVCLIDFSLLHNITPWQLSEGLMRARPPPLQASSALLCLRTTVLVI